MLNLLFSYIFLLNLFVNRVIRSETLIEYKHVIEQNIKFKYKGLNSPLKFSRILGTLQFSCKYENK